ncbi:MAG: cobaltochelatase subunit CobN, partial [Pseudomonadota bacterium]
MHLLTAQAGAIEDGTEPVDLDQSPADIVILTATDTEIAGLAAAQAVAGEGAPSLRLASLQSLRHNFSVDLHVEKTLAHAKLIVLRLLGGHAYWPYGTDEVVRLARGAGIPLAVLPGCANPDPALYALSTLPDDACRRLWTYLVEGGPENYAAMLADCAHLIGRAPKPPAPAPLPKAGLYAPGGAPATLDHLLRGQGPVAAITFYRALIQAGDLAPVDALTEALRARGMRVLPIFVASLKDEAAGAIVSDLVGSAEADIVLNATAFAASAAGRDWLGTPLNASGAPVLQVAFSQSAREPWEASPRGFGPRDLAMHVSLPEIDGRIGAQAVSFKGVRTFDEAVQAPILGHVPDPGRIAQACDLAAAWVRLRRTPTGGRCLAIVLNDGSAGDGRLGFAVGLDAPESVVQTLRRLAEAGYAIPPVADAKAVLDALRGEPQRFGLEDYRAFFDNLPKGLRDAVTARWGQPEDDPGFDGEGFAIRAAALGNAVLAAQPPRALDEDAASAAHHDPAIPPTHAYIAFHAWLRARDPHAIVHFGTHGSLEWLPGKATALSGTCWPEALLGAVPLVYPFVVNDPGEAAQAKRRLSAVTIGHLTPPLADAETHGRMAGLERLVDEYYEASGGDARRAEMLARDILIEAEGAGVARDSGVETGDDETAPLTKIDAILCDLKRQQVRDGLHVFGAMPEAENAERLLQTLPETATEELAASPEAEMAALLTALDGRFVRPGPAGAPTRGRADVLPTGRNLYSVDGRGVP